MQCKSTIPRSSKKVGDCVAKWLLTWWERELRTWHSWWPRRPAWGQPPCTPGSRSHTCPVAGNGQTLRHCHNQKTTQSSVPPTSTSTPLLPSPSIAKYSLPQTPTPCKQAPSPGPDPLRTQLNPFTQAGKLFVNQSPCPLAKGVVKARIVARGGVAGGRGCWVKGSWGVAREDEEGGKGRRPSDQEEAKDGGWAWFQRAHHGCSQLWPLVHSLLDPPISHVFLTPPFVCLISVGFHLEFHVAITFYRYEILPPPHLTFTK